MHLKNAYIAKDLESTADQTIASEFNGFLGTADDENDVISQFCRVFKPFRVIRHLAHRWNPVCGDCGAAAKQIWPKQRNYQIEQVEGNVE